MAMLLFPPTGSGKHIANLCAAVDIDDKDLEKLPQARRNDVVMLRKGHAELLLATLWKKIEALALPHANKLSEELTALQDQVEGEEDSLQTPVKKKARYDPLEAAGLLSPASDSGIVAHSPPQVSPPQSPNDVVQQEMTLYKTARTNKKAKEVRGDVECLKWWDKQVDEMPCLRMAAKALMGILSGSGGLELDIGGFKDVLPPKRGSTAPGLVEVQLLLNINKKLVTLKTDDIPKLGSNWMSHIPTRPFLPDDCMEVGHDEAVADDECTDLFGETETD